MIFINRRHLNFTGYLFSLDSFVCLKINKCLERIFPAFQRALFTDRLKSQIIYPGRTRSDWKIWDFRPNNFTILYGRAYGINFSIFLHHVKFMCALQKVQLNDFRIKRNFPTINKYHFNQWSFNYRKIKIQFVGF